MTRAGQDVHTWPRRLASHLELTSGVVTAAQATELGVSPRQLRRLVSSGQLTRVGAGVYLDSARLRTQFEEQAHADPRGAKAGDDRDQAGPLGDRVPAVVRGQLVGRVRHQRRLVGPGLEHQLEVALGRVPFDVQLEIAVGDRVTSRVDPYPGETFEGTIKTVGGIIDPKTRTMFAEAEFANRDGRLRPGLFARVETKLK